MNIKDAVANRFRQVINERKITPHELANLSGVTPSTVYSMFDKSRRDVSVTTVKKLCDGLDMTIDTFFNTKEFRELEQEIK